MSASDEIAARTERFVAGLQGVVTRAARAAVEEAFASLGGGKAPAPVSAAGSAPARAPRPRSAPPKARGAARGVAVRKPEPAPKKGSAQRPPSRQPRSKAVAAPQADPGALRAAAPAAPKAGPADSHTAPLTEREERVLGAVADLVSATAADVVDHAGLPNGSVTVALRALVARGRLSRRDAPSGVEYTLPARAPAT